MTVAAPTLTPPAPKPKRVTYPDRDGKPMAETELHRDLMFYCIGALQNFYAERMDVQVSGNNFIYYEEGNPAARISPDCYVVFGVPKRIRTSYFVWREQQITPAVVFEFTSKKTRREDVHKKRPLYEQVLRVAEYFQFDPTQDYLKPPLQGYRLEEGRYVAIPLQNSRLHSEQLGLDLVSERETFRLWDPRKGEWLLSVSELAQARAVAEQQAEELAQVVIAETRRAETEAQAREVAEQRADELAQVASAEIRARETAEVELAHLRAEIEALRRQS